MSLHENEREKALRVAAEIRTLLAANELVGVVTLGGQEGVLENHFMFDAPWFKVIVTEHPELGTSLRLMHATTDRHRDLENTLGALSGMAQLTGINGLALMHASETMDKQLGAQHTPLHRPDK